MRPLLFSLLMGAATLSAEEFSHADWDQVARQRVNAIGEVDYAGLRADRAALDRYLERLAAVSPDNQPQSFPDDAARIAYWINAYNALTVAAVIERDPFPGVQKVSGFFKRAVHTVGGGKLSLDDIEHEILRKRFEEPRLHFVLVCASVSCPRIAPFAFTGERLEQQLEDRARLFVNEPRNVSVDGSTVMLSKILDWYGGDFKPSGGVVAFLRARRDDFPANPRLRYFGYDWSPNSRGSRARSSNALERATQP